ncbi:MAG: hypothetical protein ACLR56_06260 [Oscillospiraceae bacterium]
MADSVQFGGYTVCKDCIKSLPNCERRRVEACRRLRTLPEKRQSAFFIFALAARKCFFKTIILRRGVLIMGGLSIVLLTGMLSTIFFFMLRYWYRLFFIRL